MRNRKVTHNFVCITCKDKKVREWDTVWDHLHEAHDIPRDAKGTKKATLFGDGRRMHFQEYSIKIGGVELKEYWREEW